MKQKVQVLNNAKNHLKKYKPIEIQFSPAYFYSTTKAVTTNKFYLDKSFQEILYRTDNWINEGSGWITASIKSQYINVSAYRSLSGSFYTKLLVKLRFPKK